MLLAVVLTGAAFAVIVLVLRVEARHGAPPQPQAHFEAVSSVDQLDDLRLPRAVWGYEPQAVRAALQAAVRVAAAPPPPPPEHGESSGATLAHDEAAGTPAGQPGQRHDDTNDQTGGPT